MEGFKVSLFTTILLVISGRCVSACSSQVVAWDCNELPLLTAEFSGVTITTCGKSYPKSLFEEVVRVSYAQIDESKSYTLIMVDPDAPGSPTGQGWLHLIRSSIPGAELAAGGNSAGFDVTAYNKPTPPKNTGTHRYYLYLYEEGGQSPNGQISKRSKFDIHQYASDNSLCGPVAMNMFITEF